MVQNDQEAAQIAGQAVGIISNETIVRNFPWVKNVQDELDKIKEEKAALEEGYDPFKDGKGLDGKSPEKKNEND